MGIVAFESTLETTKPEEKSYEPGKGYTGITVDFR